MSEDMDVTERVRALSGRSIWNPHVVGPPPPDDGGPTAPPIPAMFPPPASGVRPPEMRDEDEHEEPSVIVAAKLVQDPEAKLVVLDNVAHFKGRSITLEPRDVKAITRLVVQAMHRETSELLKGLGAPLPRKRRNRKKA